MESFKETCELLDEYRQEIRATMEGGPATVDDNDQFLDVATRIVKWGGIGNLASLPALGQRALTVLGENAELLRPEFADTDLLHRVTHMTSGYSKIYSLMIDDFPMYDSRVACALTSLIYCFCSERELGHIPESLSLGVLAGKGGNPRDPSDEMYRFPPIYSEPSRHAVSNVKAAWLLGALVANADTGPFFDLREDWRLRAVEASHFMIGYKPLGRTSVVKS